MSDEYIQLVSFNASYTYRKCRHSNSVVQHRKSAAVLACHICLGTGLL